MRWLPFAILAGLTLVIQTTSLGRQVAINSIWPEWTFILLVHYALWGPRVEVAVAGCLLGLSVDLLGSDRVGLHAFCYGLTAWAIGRIREVLFRDHPATHLVMTLVFAAVVQALTGCYRWWRLGGEPEFAALMWTAAYTALWAPVVHWPLQRMRHWTGLTSRHRGRAR